MQGGIEKGIAVALLLLLALSSCTTFSRSRGEATIRFAEIYAEIEEADGKFEEGDYRMALELYQRALIGMEDLSDTFPDWKPDYLAYKRKECVDKIERSVALLGPQEQMLMKSRKVYLQAVESLRKEEIEDAAAKLKRAIEINPDYFDAHWMLGNAYEKLGETGKAIASYRKAGEIDPSSPLPHQSMGELYETMEKHEEALEEFKKVIQADPENVAPYIYSSWVYVNMGEFEEALDISKKALEIDPDNKVIYNNIGLICQKMEMFSKAIAAYKRAIIEDYYYVSPYQNLGLVYALQGRYAESIDQYKQVLELDPGNASAHFNLGISYKRLSKRLLARYHFEQAAKLYGYDTEDGMKALDKLEEVDSTKVGPAILNFDDRTR